jgi:hypothetical protein
LIDKDLPFRQGSIGDYIPVSRDIKSLIIRLLPDGLPFPFCIFMLLLQRLGIEIYKGKPIWYGTRNFFAQSQFMKRFPGDTYKAHGFNPDDLPKVKPAYLYDSRQQHNMPHWSVQSGGVIAVLGMEGGKFREMKLYPFSLGYDYAGANTGQVRETGIRMEGRPMLADRENAERIIAHVKGLSVAFGTSIDFKDGIGVLRSSERN